MHWLICVKVTERFEHDNILLNDSVVCFFQTKMVIFCITVLKIMDHICYFCLFMRVCLLVPCGHLLGKGLTSWLSFVMSNCEVVTFPLISLVRCGA